MFGRIYINCISFYLIETKILQLKILSYLGLLTGFLFMFIKIKSFATKKEQKILSRWLRLINESFNDNEKQNELTKELLLLKENFLNLKSSKTK